MRVYAHLQPPRLIKGAPYKATNLAVRRGVVYKIKAPTGAILYKGNLEEMV